MPRSPSVLAADDGSPAMPYRADHRLSHELSDRFGLPLPAGSDGDESGLR